MLDEPLLLWIISFYFQRSGKKKAIYWQMVSVFSVNKCVSLCYNYWIMQLKSCFLVFPDRNLSKMWFDWFHVKVTPIWLCYKYMFSSFTTGKLFISLSQQAKTCISHNLTFFFFIHFSQSISWWFWLSLPENMIWPFSI